MSRHISNARDIKPEQKKWTSLVQVLENGHTQKSLSGYVYKRVILADSEGTKLTALVYGDNNIRYFAKLFTQYKKYYISNAAVIENEVRYRISSYPYSWILNNKTLVEEYIDSTPGTLTCPLEFTNFSDLHKYAETDSLQNVKAIVLTCLQPKEQTTEISTKREVVIVNEEKKLLLLTLWKPFDENEGAKLADMTDSSPMIIGLRLRVTTFNSLSLATRSTSGFMINPPVAQDLQMQGWYDGNKAELQQMLEMKTYKNVDLLLPYPKEEDIVSVATAVASLKNKTTCWIKGKVGLATQQRSIWYTACANCQKALDADLTWIVTCPSCRQESEVQALSKVTIQIHDGTAHLHATMCSPHVEKFIPFTALQLKQAEEDGIDLQEEILASIQQHTIVAFIRTFDSAFQRQSEMKITVVQAYKVPAMLPAKKSITLPTKTANPKPSTDVTYSGGKEQLFTPSTKLVLEEIATASNSVKRSLSFTNEDTNPEENATVNKPQHSILHIKKEVGAQGKDGSPKKKTKDH